MNTKSIISAFIMLAFFSHVVVAERPNYIFHLDEADGLSSRNIRNVSQDARGFVWIATSDGLNRFNGRTFETFSKENSGLPSNQINDVLQDPTNADRIWIATRNEGISVYDYSTGDIEYMYEASQSPDIPSLSLSSDGSRIWVTNYHFPPDLFDPAIGKRTKLYDETPEDLPRAFWRTVESPDGKSLYIGHDGRGFTVVDLKTKKFKNYQHDENNQSSIIGNHVYSIFPDGEGRVWLGTDKGVSIFNSFDHSFINIYPSEEIGGLLPGNVWAIMETTDGDLWFATGQGGISILPVAQRLNSIPKFERIAHNANINRKSNISSSSVFCMFEDTFGNKWIGNENNALDVVSYSRPFFMQYEPFKYQNVPAFHQTVWSTMFDRNDHLWIGGENAIMDIGNFTPRVYNLPTMSSGYSAIVRTMLDAKDGKIWLGTNNSGAFAFDPISKSFRRIKMKDKDIRHIIEDSDGSKLIATKNGVYRSINGDDAVVDSCINAMLPDLMTMVMLKDSKRNLWIGTFGKGAVKIPERGKAMIFQKDNGMPSNTINDIFEDDKGRIWIASRDGAVMLNQSATGIDKTFTEEQGLASGNVKAIRQDANGNIWFANNKGMAHYDIDKDTLSFYSRSFGAELPAVTEKSGILSPMGGLLFGTFNGMLQLSSRSYNSGDVPVKFIISKLTAYNKDSSDQNMKIEIPVNGDHISLPYNLNTFTLKFADLDITHAANSDYSYNMQGVNEVWSPMSYDNEALYRDLKPGNYVFRIRNRLNGEEWSEPITLAKISITPPMYLSWWAKLFYVLTICLIIVMITLFYKHKLDLEQKLVIEKENNKNSNLLNEERLAFFTNITHELRTPLSLIVGPIEDMVNDESLNVGQRKKLLTIRTSSMRLLNLINGILEFRKTETRNRKLEVVYGNLSNYVREIGLRYKELANNQDVVILIDMPVNDEIFAYYDPEIITTVVNNLMSNSMKYTLKGSITLRLGVVEEHGVEYVELSVADTGQGIPPEDLPHIFERYYQAHHNKKISGTGIGLALTKNLVDLHEGTITVDSTPGVGSTFAVRFVQKNNYPAAKHREVEIEKNNTEPQNLDEEIHDSTLSILVVEDDADVREYIVQSFGDSFKVYEATNGREGLQILREKMPDIVVSDIMMPEMDGIELCSAIKSDFMTSHIPVILLTAKDSLLDKEAGYASGADSYITKPFSSNLLKARINNIIESRHQLTIRLLGNENTMPVQSKNDSSDVAESEKLVETTALTRLDSDFLNKVRNLVEENLEIMDLDVPFIADKMCMSHSTLYRKVKGITGMTPNEFIKKIKLAKACELLKSGKVSISDISYATGFSNPAYFRRVFKAEYGVSPTQFLSDQPINI